MAEQIDRLLAKSSPPAGIAEHTRHLLERMGQLLEHVKLSDEDREILEKAILYHDLGKANPCFQRRIRGLNCSEGDFPHNLLSVIFVPPGLKNEDILLKIVAFHHWRNMPPLNDTKYLARVYSDVESLLPLLRDEMRSLLGEINPVKRGLWFRRLRMLEDFYKRVRERGRESIRNSEYRRFVFLLGLLNRLDHSASAGVDVEKPPVDKHGGAFRRFEELGITTPWQAFLLKSGNVKGESGILVASTGMGKTEFALMWSGQRKMIYTLPMRASTNAMYERLGRLFGRENVGLLHSESLSFVFHSADMETDDVFHLYDTARQLSHNITVTTADQIFTSALRYRGFEKIYATLSYSTLVIDEIQSYSPRTLAVIVRGIREIQEMGGKWLIITATFPRFLTEKGYIEDRFLGKKFSDELRHSVVKREEDLLDESTLEHITRFAREGKRVLVIANTVARAQEIYRRLTVPSKMLLHSRYTWMDRRSRENMVVGGEFGGVLVSTQVVEVSLDIDFDVLFTDLAPYDVLIQRMGRVFRRRMWDGDGANVFVFRGDIRSISGGGKVYETGLLKMAWNFLEEGPLSEEKKMETASRFYSMENLKNTDYFALFENAYTLSGKIVMESRKEAQDIFRDIYSVDIIPESLLEEPIGESASASRLGLEPNLPLVQVLEMGKHLMGDRASRLLFMDLIRGFMVGVPFYYLKDVRAFPISDVADVDMAFLKSVRVASVPYDEELGVVKPDGESGDFFI